MAVRNCRCFPYRKSSFAFSIVIPFGSYPATYLYILNLPLSRQNGLAGIVGYASICILDNGLRCFPRDCTASFRIVGPCQKEREIMPCKDHNKWSVLCLHMTYIPILLSHHVNLAQVFPIMSLISCLNACAPAYNNRRFLRSGIETMSISIMTSISERDERRPQRPTAQHPPIIEDESLPKYDVAVSRRYFPASSVGCCPVLIMKRSKQPLFCFLPMLLHHQAILKERQAAFISQTALLMTTDMAVL